MGSTGPVGITVTRITHFGSVNACITVPYACIRLWWFGNLFSIVVDGCRRLKRALRLFVDGKIVTPVGMVEGAGLFAAH